MPHGHGGLQSLAALSPDQLGQLSALSPSEQRGLASGFSIQNPTVTGGSTFLDLLNRFRSLLNERQLGQAAVGQDLFGSLLGAQMEANRRPISLVNQLALSGQVGSQFPLSQASEDQLRRYRTPNQNPLLQRLMDRLDIFSEGMNTPAQLAHGGQLIVDPSKSKTSGGGSVAGPVTINDRSGKTVAVAGESGGAEKIDVQPIPAPIQKVVDRFGPKEGVFIGDIGRAVQAHTTQKGEKAVAAADLPSDLSRTERFRALELLRLRPDLDIERIVAIARSPAGLEALAGTQTDPRAAAARLIGEAIGQDNRFSDSFVRSLALGRPPAPGTEATARDVTTLSPDLLASLQSLIGPDLFSEFAFELNALSPTGTRARQAVTGGVRV